MFSKSFLSAITLVLAAHLAAAHYTFPALIANGATSADWQYVRTTANHYVRTPLPTAFRA